ncbi:hypothetical protein DFH07DRAFT_156737 [Mycena maculata]|uniref:TERF2-interacting telomeric protein 1 Myb domain-containing protein n=1 Tax=Mycena maculata TaxID=230809 RepID=A0AAD7I035_9AGAR|nr:hypothetical protein DFH07DRAFT_156737 [Mycena maculata]
MGWVGRDLISHREHSFSTWTPFFSTLRHLICLYLCLMASRVHTRFTDNDDALLVKYIAKYNPGVQGRSGNKIYETLVENAENKWSWAARHPWSGWRDRYRRKEVEFNRRIRKYQAEKNLPTENAHYIPGTQKRKVSDDEDMEESKRKRKRASMEYVRKRAKVEVHEEEESGSEGEVQDEIEYVPFLVHAVLAFMLSDLIQPGTCPLPPHACARYLSRHRDPGRTASLQ